jgi:hypothetical protein
MNKIVSFLMVGLFFAVLNVATVSAHTDTADCGGVPCPTGDDAHTGGAQDCANLRGGDASPTEVAACWDNQAVIPESHAADSAARLATGGNAPADCGGVPCPTGNDDAPPEHGVALTIDSPSCSSGAPVVGCPNAMPGTGATMAPLAGNGMNPMPGAVPMVPPANPGNPSIDCPAGTTCGPVTGNVIDPAGSVVVIDPAP